MKKNVIIYILLSTLFSSYSFAQSGNPMKQLWNDPEFKKDFTASYGVIANYEPDLDDEDKKRLKSYYETIKQNPKSAITKMEKELKEDDNAAFYFILANLYFQEGNIEKAKLFYNKSIKKYPQFRRAHKNLGLVSVQAQDFQSAVLSLSKAMELGEIDERAYGLLGYSYLTLEKYFPAEVAYRQAILMQPNQKDWKLGLAQCLLATEQYADASGILETLLFEDQDNVDYWILQGNAYIGLEKSLKAARNFEIVKKLGGADFQTLNLLGDIYISKNMPDLALIAYSDSSKLAKKSDLNTLTIQAQLLTQTGNYEQSDSLIKQIRKKFSKSIDDENDLKLLNFESKIAKANGESDLAAEILMEIIKRDLLNGSALIELANYYAEKNLMEEAVLRYEQAQKIRKFERKALIAHAQSLVINRDYDEAVPLLNRALRIESDKNLKEYAERVERYAARGL